MSQPELPGGVAKAYETTQLYDEVARQIRLYGEAKHLFDTAETAEVIITGSTFLFENSPEPVPVVNQPARVTRAYATQTHGDKTVYMRLLMFPEGGDYEPTDVFLIADETEDITPVVSSISTFKFVSGARHPMPGAYINNQLAIKEDAAYFETTVQAIAANEADNQKIIRDAQAAKAAKVAAVKAAELHKQQQADKEAARELAAARKRRDNIARKAVKIGAGVSAVAAVFTGFVVGVSKIDTGYCDTGCTIRRSDARNLHLTDGADIAIGETAAPLRTFEAAQGPGLGLAQLPELGYVGFRDPGVYAGSGSDITDKASIDTVRQIVLYNYLPAPTTSASPSESTSPQLSSEESLSKELICERAYITLENPGDKVRVETDNPLAQAMTFEVTPTYVEFCEPRNLNQVSGMAGRVIFQRVPVATPKPSNVLPSAK